MLSTPNHIRRFHHKKQVNHRTCVRKLVCFTWGNEKFAVDIKYVQYILKDFSSYGLSSNGYSLVRHNNETIALVNLSQLFPNSSAIEASSYLIVFNINRQKVGIAVDFIPTILEVLDEHFSDVPDIYKQALNSKAVSKLIQTKDDIPVFYLEIAFLVSDFENQLHPEIEHS